MTDKLDVIEVLKELVEEKKANALNPEFFKVISKSDGVTTSVSTIAGVGVIVKVNDALQYIPGVKLLANGTLVKI